MPLAIRYAIPFALALIAPGVPDKSVWEKTLAPGVTFRMERDRTLPLDVYALRITPGTPGVELFPALTGKTVYDESKTNGRGTTSKMVEEHEGQAGINADFFPLSASYSSGDPLGLMVQNNRLISAPYVTRSFFAWGSAGAKVGYANLKASVKPTGAASFPIDGINQDCPVNATVLNDENAGVAIAKAPNVMAILTIDDAITDWGLEATATVESVTTGQTRTPVPAGKYVLVGQGTDADRVASLRPGSKVQITANVDGFDHRGLSDAIGGGPQLVKGGVVSVTAKEEGFPASFSETRHPRTAIGRNAAGDVWLVVIDGRTQVSRGATLNETAEVMRGLGCVDAINLDGGGSSAMNILGTAVNRPSDGGERSVANGIVVKFPVREASAFTVKVESGVAKAYRGKTQIPDREIVWSSRGPLTVDQDGRLNNPDASPPKSSPKPANQPKTQIRATMGPVSVEVETR